MTDDLALLTRKEVAAWLRCSTPTVDRLVARGAFRATHVGSALRIYRESVLGYIEAQEGHYRPKGSRATLGARTAARFREAR